MTQKEAILKQNTLRRLGFPLGWWYGTDCRKCCGVYPEFISDVNGHGLCAYRCPVCGKESSPAVLPWLARDAWNAGQYAKDGGQISFY